MNQVDYRLYLQSPEWQKKRKWVLSFWGDRCALCNSPDSVERHHRTYARLGHELLTDLIALCDPCHDRFHRMNAQQAPQAIGGPLLTLLDKYNAAYSGKG